MFCLVIMRRNNIKRKNVLHKNRNSKQNYVFYKRLDKFVDISIHCLSSVFILN